MKQNKIVFIISLVILLLAGSIAVAAAAGSPGSEDDPVVTKSYVDQRIAELKGSNGSGGAVTGSVAVFQLVEVEAGRKIIGGAGTEMILRGGEATAVDNGVDGISDLTAGVDLKGGTTVTRNHHLLVPMADGRGIQTKLKAWVMIKGEYSIE